MSNRVERNLLVPLSDGETLAVDAYLPAEQPSPAVVSYYPYHKDDVIGGFFEYANRYFAEQGYAAVLADFRGLGNSSGLPGEAMNAREADDGAELVEWIASQPWCDGSVGMWGLSYGGITSFKTAAVRPPHLKAIVPVIGSADIYLDWVYPGGCLNCLGLMGWGSYMVAMQMVPPMLQDPEGRWMEVWWNRLHNARPYILDWHAHPERDASWDSKTTTVEDIEVPTFLIGGWRDIFPEGMVSPYSRLSGPRKLLMGPWLHCAPDQSPVRTGRLPGGDHPLVGPLAARTNPTASRTNRRSRSMYRPVRGGGGPLEARGCLARPIRRGHHPVPIAGRRLSRPTVSGRGA